MHARSPLSEVGERRLDDRKSLEIRRRRHSPYSDRTTRAVGRGLAYATENESHRLNVRALNMSAFPDDPDHFWRWLRANRLRSEDRFCFVPRLVCGRYLA
jgi:FAD-NAD(P)-binding